MTSRVIVVSDTHLSPANVEADANWHAVVRHVDETRPDAVIHLGDLTLDGANDQGDLHYARRQLDRLAVECHVVPGNHDIGDNPWDGQPLGAAVSAERRQRWLDIMGVDQWSLELEGWRLVAIDAQLLGSGLDADDAQWAWLEDELAGGDGASTVLITHKPLTGPPEELASAPPYRFLPGPS